MTKSTGGQVRAVSAEIVDAVVSGGQSLDAAITKNEQRVAANDRSLLRMFCYGTLRHHWRLQEWIDQLVSKPLRKQDRVINALLAVGLYQIVEMHIPDHAVVSETVDAARQLRRPKLAGLVNACLRRFVRDDLSSKSPASDESRWNHPDWLINRIRKDWPDDWQAILTANAERAPMCCGLTRRAIPPNNIDSVCERLVWMPNCLRPFRML
jgi:16S rRNA (cytosine967-C5)-methyltransferase